MELQADTVVLRQMPGQGSGRADRPARRTRETGTWFEAPCPFGNMQLFAEPKRDVARHALDAALLLRRCEPLLVLLDRWCGLEPADG